MIYIPYIHILLILQKKKKRKKKEKKKKETKRDVLKLTLGRIKIFDSASKSAELESAYLSRYYYKFRIISLIILLVDMSRRSGRYLRGLAYLLVASIIYCR